MLAQLKDKFSKTTKCSDKMTMLPVLPSTWSSKEIEGVSNFSLSVKNLINLRNESKHKFNDQWC